MIDDVITNRTTQRLLTSESALGHILPIGRLKNKHSFVAFC
ncbi:hypothetical protein DDI_3394 [Dickeya dianthicola RNS04.9]|nr:hypothetical protein DDI_3394 [Dickeya dianthicola RNS04.9]